MDKQAKGEGAKGRTKIEILKQELIGSVSLAEMIWLISRSTIFPGTGSEVCSPIATRRPALMSLEM